MCARRGALVPAPPDVSRLSVVCLRATPRSLEASLCLDDWTGLSPRKLQALLSQPLYAASRPAEKTLALSSVLRIDGMARELSFELNDICAGLADAFAQAVGKCGCAGNL